MLKIALSRFGGPEVLKVIESVDARPPQPHEVLVRTVAAAVNPSDTMLRDGSLGAALASMSPPYVPGMDLSGVVEAVGTGVRHLEAGMPVMAMVSPLRPEGGAQAERVVVPAEMVVRMPDRVDFVQAASLPMNGVTAIQALEMLALPAGATLAITGAAGVLGGYVAQIAGHMGIRVIAAAATDDEEAVRGKGADLVLPPGKDFLKRLVDVAPDGVNGFLDAGCLGADSLSAVRDAGTYVYVRPQEVPPTDRVKSGMVFVISYPRVQQALQKIARFVEEEVLAPAVEGVYAPHEIQELHRRLEGGGIRGRLIVKF
ncbi:NADP-dependent oxidoreductase [Streptomyces sp. cg2]|uniref:NADP-dependent oxidoreductase n=1 Tax=Streptomyces sp. cg2 TaxID=3238799 RepID=UPI0034E2D063